MTATLKEIQTDLLRLVELASQGEEVVITVDGRPTAKLTAAANPSPAKAPDMAAWLADLEGLRRKYSTGKTGLTVEQILEEDRSERL
jgi:antitoxin (DNA-binding transcriptional repressor) of toxin-antitoxin stability system